jgi:hypothetical protein
MDRAAGDVEEGAPFRGMTEPAGHDRQGLNQKACRARLEEAKLLTPGRFGEGGLGPFCHGRVQTYGVEGSRRKSKPTTLQDFGATAKDLDDRLIP